MTSDGRQVFIPGDEGVNAYQLLTALVVPRPIAWVSTLSADGIGNLAPHSFFTVACDRPPIVQFTSIGAKDTLANVLATGEFVVNVAPLPMVDLVNASSATYDPDVDEAVDLDIAMQPSELVRPSRVVDSPASLECVLHSTIELGGSTVVLGTVVAITVRDEALVEGNPAMARLQPLSRLGRDEWGLPPEVIKRKRPKLPDT